MGTNAAAQGTLFRAPELTQEDSVVVMRPQLGTVTDVPSLFANLPCPRVTENSVSVDVRAKYILGSGQIRKHGISG